MDGKLKKALLIWFMLFIIIIVVCFSMASYFQSMRNAYLTMSCNGEKIFDQRPIDKAFDYQDEKCDDIDFRIDVR